MAELWTEIMQRIDATNGFGLALIGMGVVFSGLVTLFFCMIILKNSIMFLEKKSKIKQKKSNDTLDSAVTLQTNHDMNHVAAAIGLALHLYKIRHKSKELTIQRKPNSPWKQAKRSRAMERF